MYAKYPFAYFPKNSRAARRAGFVWCAERSKGGAAAPGARSASRHGFGLTPNPPLPMIGL